MRALFALLPVLALGACSVLPSDGPASRSAPREAARADALFSLVDLDYAATQQVAAHPPAALTGLSGQASAARADLIAEGDVLAVSVFEAGGAGLFSRPSESASGAATQALPRLVVDAGGSVAIPYTSGVKVAGLTPAQAAEAVRQALRRRAVDPQVTLDVAESHANEVAVIGAVRNAGHFRLGAHNDRILDVLASAGGPTRPPADLVAVVWRDGRSAEVPLAVLLADPGQNIRLAPQDQIRILERTRKYSTFGAVGHVSQTAIDDESLTLAAAISRAGGLDTNSANGAAVMLFRFERPEVARALGARAAATPKGVPVVYRLNLRKPDGLFVANNFAIQSDDLLYVPRSDITEAEKFLNLVNTVTQITYNVRVTSVIP